MTIFVTFPQAGGLFGEVCMCAHLLTHVSVGNM